MRDKFNEILFWAEIDSQNGFLSQVKNQTKLGKTLFEKEAAAKAFAKKVRQTPIDKAAGQTRKYLKDTGYWLWLLIKGLVFA